MGCFQLGIICLLLFHPATSHHRQQQDSAHQHKSKERLPTGRLTYYLLAFAQTYYGESSLEHAQLDLAQEIAARFAPAFVCSSYVLVLGSWVVIYRTLADILQHARFYVSSNASVPNMFKAPSSRRNACVIVSCLVLCALLFLLVAVTVVVVCAVVGVDTSSAQARIGSYTEAAKQMKRVLMLPGVLVYLLLAVAYAVYAVLLCCLFRGRLASKRGRRIVRSVVFLSAVLAACFAGRTPLILLHPDPPAATAAYYFVTDFLPQLLTILLYMQSLTAASTTARESRAVWAAL